MRPCQSGNGLADSIKPIRLTTSAFPTARPSPSCPRAAPAIQTPPTVIMTAPANGAIVYGSGWRFRPAPRTTSASPACSSNWTAQPRHGGHQRPLQHDAHTTSLANVAHVDRRGLRCRRQSNHATPITIVVSNSVALRPSRSPRATQPRRASAWIRARSLSPAREHGLIRSR